MDADKKKSLAAIRDSLVRQAKQRIAAPAHLNCDFT
jgi:hypothetical protein